MRFIDLPKQYKENKDAINRAIQRVLDHGQYILGPEVFELEERLAEFVGVEHAIGVGSGTEALQIALMALGIGPGDEVITVPFTWISTAEAVCLVGATPVFVDIEREYYNLDCAKIERLITERTKAIIPVSNFGQMPDFSSINAFAKRHGLYVIEDGAQSFGAMQEGTHSCAVTHIGATSFYPSKPLGCYGDGGALFTNDDELAGRMRAIRTHGGKQRHCHTLVGLNGRLDTIQAAVVLEKFKLLPAELERRETIAANYSAGLREVCRIPKVRPGNTHAWAQYTIACADREATLKFLSERGIPTAVHYPKCLHEQPVFANLGYKLGSFPEAESASSEVISLPMHPWLSSQEQQEIIEAVCEAMLVEVAK